MKMIECSKCGLPLTNLERKMITIGRFEWFNGEYVLRQTQDYVEYPDGEFENRGLRCANCSQKLTEKQARFFIKSVEGFSTITLSNIEKPK